MPVIGVSSDMTGIELNSTCDNGRRQDRWSRGGQQAMHGSFQDVVFSIVLSKFLPIGLIRYLKDIKKTRRLMR